MTSASGSAITSSAPIMSDPGGGGGAPSSTQQFAKYPIGNPPVLWKTNQPLDPKDHRTAMYTNVNVFPKGRQYYRKDGGKGKVRIDFQKSSHVNAARAGKESYNVLENLKGYKNVGVSIAPKPTTQEYVMKFVSIAPRPGYPDPVTKPAYKNERSDSIKAKIERMREKQATMNSLVGSVLTHSPLDVVETIEKQQDELEELLTMAVSGKRKNVALDIESEAAEKDPLIKKLKEEQEKYNKIRKALSEECAWRSHDKIKDLLSQNQTYINLYRAQVLARSKTSTGSGSQQNHTTIPPPVCVVPDDYTKDINSIQNSDANDSMEVLADCETLNITMTRLEDLLVMLAEIKKEISSTTDPEKLRELKQEAIQLIKSTNELSLLLGHTDVIDLNESFDMPAGNNGGLEVKDEFKFEQKVENSAPTLEDIITADKLAPVSTDNSSSSAPISTDNSSSSRPTVEFSDYHSDSSNPEPSDSFDQRYDEDSLERMLPSGTVSRFNRTNQSMTGNAPSNVQPRESSVPSTQTSAYPTGSVSGPRVSAPGTTVTISGGIPSTTIAPLSGSTAPSSAQSGRPFAPRQQGITNRTASGMQTMVLDANGARIPINRSDSEGRLLHGQITPLAERLKNNLVEEIPICNCPGTARK